LLVKLRLKVPGYTLLGRIAVGGQATVYRATEETSGLTVAIKVLNGGVHADDAARERMARETAALRALNHPNIVTVIEAGRTAVGLDYIVMNHVDGRPLDAVWTDAAFAARVAPEPPARLRLFKRICDVVQSAHLKGITHRDLSPSNILITADGEPHVLDFGLASTAFDHQLSPAGRNVTVTGQFIGKLKYAAPEQARGDRGAIDIRTDVYALGVLLYQMLTGGAYPYEVVGALVDVLNHIIHTEPLPPSSQLRGLPAGTTTGQPRLVNEAIEAVVLKALAKRPADRYQSAGELAADIDQYLAGRPTAAGYGRDKAVAKSTSARGRRWFVVAAISVVVVTGIAVSARTLLSKLGLSSFGESRDVVDRPRSPSAPAATTVHAGDSAARTPQVVPNVSPGPVAGRKVDLLAGLDLKRDALVGDWSLDDGTLDCEGKARGV
jgi:serine/threonine-protein kinase